jgi:hypothetical protein
MLNLRLMPGLVVCLLSAWLAQAQPPLYYNASSATLSLNTLNSVATNGTGQATLFTADGPGVNNVNRCTAMAVDGLNGMLFFVDAQSYELWSVKLDGSGLALVESGLPNYPVDLALDVLNRKIYYATSSAIQNSNTVHRVDYTGANDTTVFTASGPTVNGGNGVSRCTAIAVDVSNSKIFLADAGAQEIWSMSLAGTGLAALATSAANSFPTDVALDTVHQQAYFTISSTVQSANLIERLNYNGTGPTTLFTASGSVQRCTALDVDVPDATIYLSDAGLGTPVLWRIPLAGGSASQVLSSLAATAKKVRFFSGPTTRPSPRLAGIQFSGSNVVLNATNGYIGGTYYVLTATNLTTPLNQWVPVFTNVLGASGIFSLTVSNSFTAHVPRQFYILRVQ